MPMVSKSGVSDSSSRMHSSIYGSAMQAKPAAASRPPSSGHSNGFRTGGAAKPFIAPTTTRNAAEARITRHGTGHTILEPPPSPTHGLGRVDPARMVAAGAAAGARAESVGALLQDGSSGTTPPASPSIYASGRTRSQQHYQHLQQQQQSMQSHAMQHGVSLNQAMASAQSARTPELSKSPRSPSSHRSLFTPILFTPVAPPIRVGASRRVLWPAARLW